MLVKIYNVGIWSKNIWLYISVVGVVGVVGVAVSVLPVLLGRRREWGRWEESKHN